MRSRILSATTRARSTAAALPRVEALRARLAEEASASVHDFFASSSEPLHQPPPPPRLSVAPKTATPSAAAAPSPMLFDRFARHHTYLRISLTEKCSLRCVYCMPEEGVDLSPSGRLLTTEETLRLARVFVGAGVTKIRLTGGEPTVRRDLPAVIGALDELRPLGLETIAMTSNGIALPRMLPSLVGAGLDKLNLSLDSLERQKFAKLTRRDGLHKVLKAIDLALELGISPLKVNCVLMAGTNDDECALPRIAPPPPRTLVARGNRRARARTCGARVRFALQNACTCVHAPVLARGAVMAPWCGACCVVRRRLLDFAQLSVDRPIDVRFIEYMPFDGNRWAEDSMVPFAQMLERVQVAHPGTRRLPTPPNDVAVSWRLPGAQGSVSFIASMTQPFCAGCNRIRLTADGALKVCLFGSDEVSLRDAMREVRRAREKRP